MWKSALIYVGAVILSLGVGAILLATMHVSPFAYYREMITIGLIDNAFPNKPLEGLISISVPLMLTSIALSLAYKIRFWNIGGEGQFIMGAVSAATVALSCGDSLSPFPLLLLMMLSAMLAAGLYGFIPAILKVKFGTNETLMTLMLNYIALYFLYYIGETKADWNFYLDNGSLRPRFQSFPQNAAMPSIKIGSFHLNISLIFTVIIFVIIFFYLYKTKHGYEISVVGDSPNTAKYAGMKVNVIIVRTMILSACLVGLAGGFYVSSQRVLSTTVTGGVGWTGIIVAWLSKLNPIGIFITSALISVLRYGCQVAAADYSTLDANFADLLQGIILFTVLAADFFLRFKIVFRSKKSGRDEK